MEYTNARSIPAQTLKRLPTYLAFLRGDMHADTAYITAGKLASALDRTEIQVRKDLAAISVTGGKPKVGFAREELIRQMEDILTLQHINCAVLAGVEGFGRALLGYDGLREYGIAISAAFDDDPDLVGSSICGTRILSMDNITPMCTRLHIHMGILCVSGERAQQTADGMIEGGVSAIWNFTGAALHVPENVVVCSENLDDSLTVLLRALSLRRSTDQPQRSGGQA